MASEIEILQVLKILGDVYSNYHLSSAAVEVYVQLLADIPGEVLKQAALDHISRSNFFPAVAELRTAAFDILEAILPIPTDYEAWAEVQAEIRRVGYVGQPQFSHALITKAIDLLGWRCLCLSENPVADRAHFVPAYQALRESIRRDARRLQLVQQFIAALKATNQPQLVSDQPEKE
jgi:hypothetical protein